MSDEFDDTQESEGIKSLRKAHDALKKQNDELLGELNKFRADQRKQSVAGILKAKGLPEKAASLYSGDDASEEAVGKWIEEFGDVFGLKQQSQDNDQQQQVQRVQQATFDAPTPELNATPANGPLVVDPIEALEQLKSMSYEQAVQAGYIPDVTGTLYDTHGR